MFVDPTHPADPSAAPAAEVEPAAIESATTPPRPRRALWRAGAAVLAIAAYGLSAQLATNEVVVKPGDTLTKIAGTYRTNVKELVAYNDLPDANMIIVGQTLAIPPGAGELRHDVRAGESLTSIASTYGSSVQAIMARNNVSDPNMIRIGQTLVVPRAATAAAAPATPAAPPTTAPPAPAVSAAPPTTTAPAALVATPTAVTSSTAPPAPEASTTAPPTTVAPTTAPPTTAAPTTSGPPATIPRVTVPRGGTVSTMWVVQPGDTIASIAARFGLAPRRLASVNALSENDELVPGQRIYVPQS